MGSYLITFKPSSENPGRGWPLSELQRVVRNFERSGTARELWRFINSHAEPGDTFFLLCQGKMGPAIIGTGTLESHPRKEDGRLRAAVRFERLVDPTVSSLIPSEQLKQIPGSERYWKTQASGIRLDDRTAMRIQELCDTCTQE